MTVKKIVIAPDSFKGSLSARDVAASIGKGLKQGFGSELPEIIEAPIADGGEGTLDTLVPPDAQRALTVTGPLFQPVTARWGTVGNTAVIEMASAAGLTLIPPEMRRAGDTTTYGVGELIAHALDEGYRDFLLTVGGSATNDGGCGMMAALGTVFRKSDGSAFVPTGNTLTMIADADITGLDPRLRESRVTAAADVRNPLLGTFGATRVYAPQKGAAEDDLVRMEKGMEHYAGLLEGLSGKNVSEIPGSGAGGGVIAPLLALTDTRLCPGIESVLSAIRFDELIESADLIITGEGKIDRQSLFGKAISGVAQKAVERNIPVYAFVGAVGDDRQELLSMGLSGIRVLVERAPSTEYSLLHAAELLGDTAREFAEEIGEFL